MFAQKGRHAGLPLHQNVEMAKRLSELYGVETAVLILLNDDWRPGVVVAHQHPGIWVETVDGRRWFVTNRQRIKESN